MKKKFVFLLIFSILIISGAVAWYFYYELPKQNNLENSVNVSISAKFNNDLVKTGYKIESDGINYHQGETLINGAILAKIPINKTYQIYNYNLDNQTYYKSYVRIDTNESKNYRVDMKLINASYLNITSNSNLGHGDQIQVNLSSDSFRDILTCIKWSSHIIFVNILNKSQVIKLDRYDNYDRCYDLEGSLNSTNNLNFTLDYRTFGIMDQGDYIRLIFIDSQDGIHSEGDLDLWGKDQNYTIKYVE